MRVVCLFLSLALGSLAMMSCGGGGSIAASDYNPGYGPFDKNGNYVEAWADKPAKKHWWARKGTTTTPASATKPSSPTKPQPTAIAKNTPSSRPPGLVSSTTRRSSPYSRPTTTVVSNPAPRATYTPKPQPTYTPRPTYTPPKPKPKPKPVKPKKPAPLRHLVKKGDTLYGLSRKHGTTVSAIQRANGLSGTTIQTGKTILIPR